MLYMNRETGEILTYPKMIDQFREDYDGEDPTNPLTYDEYYDKIDDSLKNRIVSIANEQGWKVTFDKQSRPLETGKEKLEKYAEFSQYSPAGEDFSFTVFYEDDDDLAYQISEYYEGFDVDEHIEMWIEARHNKVSGVPNTRTLCKDAEDIDGMLEKLSDAVIDARNDWNELFPNEKE